MERAGSSTKCTVFDTGSLVFLDLLGYVPLLRQLYEVVLPEVVSEELSARPGSPGSGMVLLDWITNQVPGTESARQVRQDPPKVGRGETEVIALGMELSCPVVLDDRKARLRARRAGLEITGTPGILSAEDAPPQSRRAGPRIRCAVARRSEHENLTRASRNSRM